MTRFAALLDHRQSRAQRALRIAGDLTRRTRSQPASQDTGDIRLWQCGGPGTRAPRVHALGPLLLVGELALTDLSDLRGALAADPQTDPADLVLAAWSRWGEAALDRLNGAFAFVLWDGRAQRLTAVRDRFGIHPLAYAITAQGWVFASDLSTVLAGLDATPDTDPAWVADFLSGHYLDMVATAWRGVSRLAPGHLLTLDADGARTLRVWYRLEASAPPATDGGPGPALHAALAHATTEACAQGPTATMLSGGLDSSSLALLSVGADGPARPALSLRYRDPALDEGRYIDSVLQKAGGRLDPVFLPGEAADEDIFRLDQQFDWQDQPVFAPGLNRNHHLYRAARGLGYGAILDGHGGDEIIGGTLYDIAQLARGWHWPQALGLAARGARFTGGSVLDATAFVLAMNGKRGFGRLGRKILRRAAAGSDHPRGDLVDPELARATRLDERLRDLDRPDPRDRDLPEHVGRHARLIAGPMPAVGFETMSRAAQAESMQVRYPFYDHRVAELCIWQTPAIKVAHGQPRALLREAMRGVLPEAVRLRADKANFLNGFWTALRRDPEGRFAALSADAGPLRGWVDPVTLREDTAYLARAPEPEPQTAFRLWRMLCLAVWLERGAAPAPAALLRPSPVFTSAR